MEWSGSYRTESLDEVFQALDMIHGAAVDSDKNSTGPETPSSNIGRFELIRLLGRGGMGQVWLARDTELARLVAIKFLSSLNLHTDERFRVEARLTAQLRHDNIVVIHEIGEHRGIPYMVLEYLEGTSLRDWLRRHKQPLKKPPPASSNDSSIARSSELRPEDAFISSQDGTSSASNSAWVPVIGRAIASEPVPANIAARARSDLNSSDLNSSDLNSSDLNSSDLNRSDLTDSPRPLTPAHDPGAHALPVQQAIELVIPVLRALEYAHRHGIVHRDLKPENMFMTDTGVIKILDFGIAKLLPDAREERTLDGINSGLQGLGTTDVGRIMGTQAYMSPEQWRAEHIDHRTDLWAIGIILCEIVTGRHPLAPLTTSKLALVANNDIPMPSVTQLAVDLGIDLGGLAPIIDQCLLKPRERRTPSAQELLARLESLMKDRLAAGFDEMNAPYPGLRTFQERDSSRFFGREREVATVRDQLGEHELIAVIGPSGAGKSSFVRAGLVPSLNRFGRHWDAHAIRPGRRPMQSLRQVLHGARADVNQGGSTEIDDPETEPIDLRANPGALGVALRAHARRRQCRIVLFIDQFEELYTLTEDETDRQAFIECLHGVADDPSSPLRVVLCMRADFLDRLAEQRRFMNAITRGLFFLPPMGREAQRQALVTPAAAVGYRFESPDMVEQMLDSLADTQGALPLLQSTVSRLWDMRDREERCLTWSSYRQLGGVAGTLANHADTVLAAMTSSERKLARVLLERLVTPERTRALATRAELCELASDSQAAARVLDQLISARLLNVETGGDATDATLELVHESLIDRWPTLGQWLDENQEDQVFLSRLRSAARDWQASQRSPGMLWRDEAVQEAQRFAERYSGPLSQLQRAYLQAVVDLHRRTARRKQRILRLVAALTALVTCALGYLAWRERGANAQAQRQAAHAEQQTVRALDRLRVLRAEQNFATDPTTALALLREVARDNRDQSWRKLAASLQHVNIAKASFPAYASKLDAPGASTESDPGDSTAGAVGAATEAIEVRALEFCLGDRYVLTATRHNVSLWPASGIGEPTRLLDTSERAGNSDAEIQLARSIGGDTGIVAAIGSQIYVWQHKTTASDGTIEPPTILAGHSGAVLAIAASADGTRLASASADGTGRVWFLSENRSPEILHGHRDKVVSIAMSEDGSHVLTGSADRTARAFRIADQVSVRLLGDHGGSVDTVAISPDGRLLATGASDHLIRIWHTGDKAPATLLQGHITPVRHIAFFPDSQRLLSVASETVVSVWSGLDTTEPVRTAKGHHGHNVATARLSADGSRLAIASLDQTAQLWSTERAEYPQILRGHSGYVLDIAFSSDSQRVVTSSSDGTARVWDVTRDWAPVVLVGHQDALDHVTFSSDGTRILTSSRDGTARLWGLNGTTEARVLTGHTAEIWWAGFHPDGRRVVSSSHDRTLRVWDTRGDAPSVVLANGRGGNRFVFSPDGTRVLSAGMDATARIFDLSGERDPLLLQGHKTHVYDIAFSPDGKRVATASLDNTVRIWNADGSGVPAVLRGHKDGVIAVMFSPDGSRLISGSFDGTVRMWNPGRPREGEILHPGPAAVRWAEFAPDGAFVAVGSYDGSASIWRVADRVRVHHLHGHTDLVWQARFDATGRLLATASEDNTARIWNLDTPTEPVILRGHTDGVISTDFSPDGRYVVTASHDRTARLWRVATDSPWHRDSLWGETAYCAPVATTIELLDVAREEARSRYRSCRSRVAEFYTSTPETDFLPTVNSIRTNDD